MGNAFFVAVIMVCATIVLMLFTDWMFRYIRDLLEVKRLKKKGIVTEKFTFRDLREVKLYMFTSAIIEYSELKKAQNNVKERIERESSVED